MITKHALAFTIPALVLLSTASEAQRPFNDRELENMGSRQHPTLPEDDEERAIVGYVRKMPASNLDPALPSLELDRWLMDTLLLHNEHATPIEWRLDWCEDLNSDVPDYSSELCVVAKSALISPPEETTLTLILKVGDLSQVADRSPRSIIQPPAIRELFIQNDGNSLDVRSLSDITTAFAVPRDQWPTVDLELEVDASPLRALPGDTVTLRVKVRNAGKRDAPRAEVKFSASFADMPDDGKAYRYQWFPGIPAGREVAVELPVRLPEGRGIFHASVYPFTTGKPIKARTTARNSLFLWVHQVTDPPELPAVPR